MVKFIGKVVGQSYEFDTEEFEYEVPVMHQVRGKKLIMGPDDFPMLLKLEANWEYIRDDYERLKGGPFQFPDPFGDYYVGKWDWIPFYGYSRRLNKVCKQAPKTAALLDEIPGLISAGFSILMPGLEILPHTDNYADLWRGHLCVKEAPDCAIVVGHKKHAWKNGQTIVIDDQAVHYAWNRSQQERVCLIFDFKRDLDKPFKASDRLLNAYKALF